MRSTDAKSLLRSLQKACPSKSGVPWLHLQPMRAGVRGAMVSKDACAWSRCVFLGPHSAHRNALLSRKREHSEGVPSFSGTFPRPFVACVETSERRRRRPSHLIVRHSSSLSPFADRCRGIKENLTHNISSTVPWRHRWSLRPFASRFTYADRYIAKPASLSVRWRHGLGLGPFMDRPTTDFGAIDEKLEGAQTMNQLTRVSSVPCR